MIFTKCIICVSFIFGGWSFHFENDEKYINEKHNIVGVHFEYEERGFLFAQYTNTYNKDSRMYLFTRRKYINNYLDVLFLVGILDGYEGSIEQGDKVFYISIGPSLKKENFAVNIQLNPQLILFSFSLSF